jgi:hypothetical protein
MGIRSQIISVFPYIFLWELPINYCLGACLKEGLWEYYCGAVVAVITIMDGRMVILATKLA